MTKSSSREGEEHAAAGADSTIGMVLAAAGGAEPVVAVAATPWKAATC